MRTGVELTGDHRIRRRREAPPDRERAQCETAELGAVRSGGGVSGISPVCFALSRRPSVPSKGT